MYSKLFFIFTFGFLIDPDESNWVGFILQENLYGKPITVADREMVEEKADDILSEARESDVAFLVVGDPFGYRNLLF